MDASQCSNVPRILPSFRSKHVAAAALPELFMTIFLQDGGVYFPLILCIALGNFNPISRHIKPFKGISRRMTIMYRKPQQVKEIVKLSKIKPKNLTFGDERRRLINTRETKGQFVLTKSRGFTRKAHRYGKSNTIINTRGKERK